MMEIYHETELCLLDLRKVGLDYAGPIITKTKFKRSSDFKIVYCHFHLFQYKSHSFKVVSDLTTEAFLACLRRFIARRSKPSVILGGAQRTSREPETFLMNGTKFASPTEFSYSAEEESNGTSFHFSPFQIVGSKH
ncbi:hypothetical protein TNCV_4988851 [Trichonephila clavipes]|nr:hypothetical protein TNCV_4988851 [Trichonephila clavipes]